MNKVLVVAKTEYLIAVTSKAFLIGVFMMPVFMGGAILVQYLTRDQIDLTPRRVAIVDNSGKLYDAIEKRASQRNANEIFGSDDGDTTQMLPEFLVEQYTAENTNEGEKTADERFDVALTRRVKQGELFAFAVIDADVFEPSKNTGIRYHFEGVVSLFDVRTFKPNPAAYAWFHRAAKPGGPKRGLFPATRLM